MKIIKIIPILAVVLLSLGSCAEEELAGNRVSEGEPTLMKLSLNASFRNDTPQSRAKSSESNENMFSNIRVMVFNSSGKIVTNYKEDYSAPELKPTMNIKTLSGNDCSLYIIANTVEKLDDELMQVESLTQLNAISTMTKGFVLGLPNGSLLMTGIMKNIAIAPGKSTLPSSIQMEYVSAKLTLKVIDNTPKDHYVEILGWDVENAPKNTYLIPNGGAEGQKDANDGLIGDDGAWFTSPKEFQPFEKNEAGDTYLTQYLFENRRGGRVDKTPPSQIGYPGMNKNDGDNRGKAFFAPPRATCIVIHAIHTSPTLSRTLEARIFIGNDNHSNYDIERGNNYEFTVTVNGINDIDVDTNIQSTAGSFIVRMTDQTMDSHPDSRPIKIDAAGITATVEVLDGEDRHYGDIGFDAKWVKVSPLDLMYHQVKQAGGKGQWQQEGPIGSFVRPKYIPHKSVRAGLPGGGWNSIPAGEDDDDVMTLAKATYRMCYKITDISFPGNVVVGKQLYIYADDYNAKGVARTAKIKVTFHPNGFPSDVVAERIFTITQHGYLGIYEDGGGLAVLDAKGVPTGEIRRFGIENKEESAHKLYPDIASQTTMQWGFHKKLLYNEPDKYRNGYFLTTKAVYEFVDRVDNEPANFGKTYLSKYGNGQKGTGPLAEPYTGTHSADPYYQPSFGEQVYHPIYNSSAARYCHEKNRDLNGDGLIQSSETIWYLPSQHELMMIWINNKIVNTNYSSSFYISATEIDLERYWSFIFSHGVTATGENDNFKTNVANVRCVRKLWK